MTNKPAPLVGPSVCLSEEHQKVKLRTKWNSDFMKAMVPLLLPLSFCGLCCLPLYAQDQTSKPPPKPRPSTDFAKYVALDPKSNLHHEWHAWHNKLTDVLQRKFKGLQISDLNLDFKNQINIRISYTLDKTGYLSAIHLENLDQKNALLNLRVTQALDSIEKEFGALTFPKTSKRLFIRELTTIRITSKPDGTAETAISTTPHPIQVECYY